MAWLVRFLTLIALILLVIWADTARITQIVPPVRLRPVGQDTVDGAGDPLPKGILFRLGTTRLRHWVAVGTCFTPDGKRLLSVGNTDQCLVWDLASGTLLRSLPRSSFPLAISDDLHLSVSWVKDELKITEWPSGKLVHTWPLKNLQDVIFAKDQNTLVALTSDHWVHRWDLSTGKQLSRRQIPLVNRDYWTDPQARFSPDGILLAGVLHRERSAVEHTIPLRFWNVATGKEARPSLAVARSFYDCRWSPDGRRLFALVLPYGVEAWDLPTGKRVKARKDEPGIKTTKVEMEVGDPKAGKKTEAKHTQEFGAENAEITPDGQYMLLAMFGQVVCYDLIAGKTSWTRSVAPKASGPGLKLSTVISFAFSRASKTVAVGCSCGHIALIDWTTGKDVGFSARHPGFFGGPVIFLNDGSTMVVTNAMTGRRSLRDSRTGKELRRFSQDEMLAWSPDGNHFADSESTGWQDSDPKYLLVKDIRTGKELWKIRAHPYDASFSPDGKMLTYWDLDDRTFHLVDADTGKARHVFRLPADVRKDAEANAISPDWKLVAVKAKQMPPGSGSTGWKELQVWDISGRKLWAWAVPEDWQGDWAVRFLPENKHMVLDSYIRSRDTGVACVLDATTGKKVHELPTGSRYSFLGSSPDGCCIVVAGKDANEVRNVATGRLLFQFKRNGIRTYMHNLAFAPNSQLFAFSPDDFTIEVRELRTGTVVSKFHRPTYFVTNIAFAPDSRRLSLAFNDCTIWMWDPLAGAAKRENR